LRCTIASAHGADSVLAAKPSPDGLLQCAAELRLEPQDCLYVGDTVGDGKAARAAGMVSVGVLWDSNSEEKLRNAETFDYICAT
jgi:phosphoglycolate phosphatase